MAWESSPVGSIGMVGTRRASSGANSAIIRDHRSSPRELRAHFNTFESFSSARALLLQSSSITKVQYPGKSQNCGMTYAKVYPETVAGTNIVERKHYPRLFTTRSQITIQRLSGDPVKRLQMIIRSLTTTTQVVPYQAEHASRYISAQYGSVREQSVWNSVFFTLTNRPYDS